MPLGLADGTSLRFRRKANRGFEVAGPFGPLVDPQGQVRVSAGAASPLLTATRDELVSDPDTFDWRSAVDWDIVPLLLILDTSGSMDEYTKLGLVERGVQALVEDLRGSVWSESVSLGVIAMGGDQPDLLVPMRPIDEHLTLRLQAGGGTPLGEAFRLAEEVLGEGLPANAHSPLVIFMTDGSPDDGWETGFAAFTGGAGRGSLRIGLAVGPDADTETLRSFTDEIVTLDGLADITSFFRGLARTVSVISERGEVPEASMVTSRHSMVQEY